MLAFLMAALVTHVCASVAASQFVLAELTAMDVPVLLATRLEVTVTDIWRSAPLYWAIIIPALLMTLLLSHLCKKSLDSAAHSLLFSLCFGGLLWLGNYLVNNLIGLSLIAGFRGWGVLALIFSGLVGGWCYRLLAATNSSAG
ncbi:hypothetical protein ACVBEJ_12050 [Porticoccus sp. GXU_MW_L64]